MADIRRIVEIRGGSIDYFGVGAIEKIGQILRQYREQGIGRAAVITGKGSYRVSGAWQKVEDALKSLGIEFLQFDGIRANPTVDQIDEAVKKLKGFDAR
ncbi:MAG: iron-containing alcohol dehydrogenase, partial [Nitrospirae bacterium]